jgi:hypothetical protein
MMYFPGGILYNKMVWKKSALPIFLTEPSRRKIMFFIFRLLIHMVAILNHFISVAGADSSGWDMGSTGRCLPPWDRQYRPSSHPHLFHPPDHDPDFGPLLARYQRRDALAGFDDCQGFLRQWLLGRSLWVHSDQLSELDLIPLFTNVKPESTSRQ